MDLRERPTGAPPPIRHPWELARARAVERLLARAALGPAPRLVDVGCGDAWLLGRLGRHLGAASLVGVDPCMDAPTRHQLAGGRPPIRAVPDLGALPERAFDLALLLDVLEHVEDDRDLLRQAAARLVPGGQLLITVPAHPWLFGEHDRELGHLRRYTRPDLFDVIRRAGLELLESGSLFASLLGPRLGSLVAERLRSRPPVASGPSGSAPDAPVRTGVGTWRRGPLVTRTIGVALDLDNRLLSALSQVGFHAPGLSLWARCRTR